MREAYGVSRSEVAVGTDVGFGTIQKIEQGRQDPSGRVIALLAEYFDVTMGQMYGVEPWKAPRTRHD